MNTEDNSDDEMDSPIYREVKEIFKFEINFRLNSNYVVIIDETTSTLE
jgi:hypothetical protein